MKTVVRRGLHTYGYLLIIATIITVFAALTTIGVSAVGFDTHPYTYNGESGVTIIGFNNLSKGETVVIPAYIDGKPVLALGLEGSEPWHIPGADKIGALDLAQATNLKIILPFAFYFCENLKGTIESNTLEIVGSKVFIRCSSLTSFSASNIKTVEDNAFSYCSSLNTVILSDNIKIIPIGCFYGCSSLKTVTTSSNFDTDGNLIVPGVYLPNVIEVKVYAFNYVPEDRFNINSTGDEIFNKISTGCIICDFDTEPYSYDINHDGKISEDENGVAITDINGETDDKVVVVPAEIDGKKVLALGNGKSTIVSKDSVVVSENKKFYLYLPEAGHLKVIRAMAFCNISRLTGPIESYAVEKVEEDAFGRANITSVDLHMCETVGKYGFAYNDSLKNVNLPSSLMLADLAFRSCYNLTNVILSRHGKIEEYTFYDCPCVEIVWK